MTNKKVTRRALLMSVTSLLICISMLLGTTFAWFTDEVTSGVNQIVAGNLDVELYHKNSGITGQAEKVSKETMLFDSSIDATHLWEPGAMAYETFTVKNVGSLALKYNFNMVKAGNNTVNGTEDSLLDVLKVAVIDGTPATLTREAIAADSSIAWTTLKEFSGIASEAQALYPSSDTTDGHNSEKTCTVVVYWPQSDNDNTYNLKNGKYASDATEATVGKLWVKLGINLVATQLQHEYDSFDNTYDGSADLPVVVIASSTAITSASGNDDLTITKTGAIESATVPATAASEVFNSMADNTTGASNELTMNLNVTKTGETATATGTTVDLDIDMTAVMKTTTTSGTTTNTKDVPILNSFVTINYNLGTGLANVTVTHKGAAMEPLTSATAEVSATYAEVGGYYYDATSGILTIKTKTFSPFAVTYAMEGQGTAVALTPENKDDSNRVTKDIILEAPINGSKAYVTIGEGTRLNPEAAELRLTIEKTEITVLGRTATAYNFNVSGLKNTSTTYDITSFPCSFNKEAGDAFIMMNANTTADMSEYVGSYISYADGVFVLPNGSNGVTYAIAYADPAEAEMVDLKNIQTILSVDNTVIQANDENSKGTAVKSTGASITANNFTLKDLHVLAATTTNGGLYVEGNNTTIDNSVFDARWLGNYADTIKIKGSDTTIKDTTISHYQTATSNGRYAGLELTTDTAASVTTIDNVTFNGMDGLLFRSFAGKVDITNSTFDVSNSAMQFNMDSGPNTGSVSVKDSAIKAKSIGFMRVKNGVTFENTSFETPNGTGSFTIKTGDNVTTNITFKDCTFKNELSFPCSTTTGFKTVLTFENCTYLGDIITEDNIQNLFNFSVGLTTYHVVKAYNGTTLTITVAQN